MLKKTKIIKLKLFADACRVKHKFNYDYRNQGFKE